MTFGDKRTCRPCRSSAWLSGILHVVLVLLQTNLAVGYDESDFGSGIKPDDYYESQATISEQAAFVKYVEIIYQPKAETKISPQESTILEKLVGQATESPSFDFTFDPLAMQSESPSDREDFSSSSFVGVHTHSPSVSHQPTAAPTISHAPSDFPSDVPSDAPSSVPTISPRPSTSPSEAPSLYPSDSPSSTPSDSPSDQPSSRPSASPSHMPSTSPTLICHDEPMYRSPINGLKCSDHEGTSCLQWRYLGLTLDDLEELITNCPVSCNIDCG